MKKKLLVILLTTFTAGSMLADEDGGFLAHLGRGVGEIVESPAHIGQGRKKSKKKQVESQSGESSKSSQQTKKTRRQRRRSGSNSSVESN